MFLILEVKKVEEVMDIKFIIIDEDIRIEDVIKEMIKSNIKILMVIDLFD